MKNSTLGYIGFYLFGDGLVSMYQFKDTATNKEQFYRLLRSGIGVYLMSQVFKEPKKSLQRI